MSEAEYFDTGAVDTADWDHYGLGVPRYTHFTSPIRRYADCIVHRQLMTAIAATSAGAPVRYVNVNTRGTAVLQAGLVCELVGGVSAMPPPCWAGLRLAVVGDCWAYRHAGALCRSANPPTSALSSVAQHINEKNRASKIAQRESLQLFQTLYFSTDVGRQQVIEAIVVDIKDNGFIAYSPR